MRSLRSGYRCKCPRKAMSVHTESEATVSTEASTKMIKNTIAMPSAPTGLTPAPHFLFFPLSTLRSKLHSESQIMDFFPGLTPVGVAFEFVVVYANISACSYGPRRSSMLAFRTSGFSVLSGVSELPCLLPALIICAPVSPSTGGVAVAE